MVTVHNRTDRRVSETIDAHLFDIPPKGSVQTSEKKAKALVDAHPKKLGYTPPSMYSKKDIAAVKKMNKAQLQDCCERLMDGERISPSELLEKAAAGEQEKGKEQTPPDAPAGQ